MKYSKSEAKDFAREHLRGLYAATLTPFNEDLSLDEAGYRRNFRHWIDDLGIAGLFVNGKQGEFFSMTIEERKKTMEIAVEECGDKDALVMVLPQLGESAQEAAAALAEEDWVVVDQSWDETLGGLPARLLRFAADLEDEQVRGVAAFVRARGRVLAVLGLSSAESWPTRQRALERSVRSIGRVTRPQPWSSEPDRLEIVTLDRAMTVRQIAQRYSPGIEPATLALLNQVAVDQQIRRGRRVKIIRKAR